MLRGIPLGHSISSHVVHGWCCLCPGKTVGEELNAWRVWSMTNVPEVVEVLDRNGQR